MEAGAGEAPGDSMDERTLRVVEYFKVRDLLAAETLTPMGRERAAALLPATVAAECRDRQALTSEAVALTRTGEVPLRGARDLRPMVERASREGVLDAAELLTVAYTLQVSRRLRGFLLGHRERAPRLAGTAARITPLEPLERSIAAVLDDEGQVRDNASPALLRIRGEARTLERRIREKLEAILRSSAYAKMLQEPLIMVRGERFVIPVRAEARGQFPGLVHDQSSSGATVFMEPLVVVPMGNRRRELEAMERAEIERLLAELSHQVAAVVPEVLEIMAVLGDVDLAVAKALLSERWRGVEPVLREQGALDLRAARHPLLLRRDPAAGAAGEGKTAQTLVETSVVPIDVRLGADFGTLIITGPNTGGKTVTLKTIGLLVLMAQAGLHIPAEQGSAVAVMGQVFADIGDEQSIEQNLSTFSSHMTSIIDILARVAPPALVLLDEIGAGTDPTEGTALARAIIETLHERGVWTAATTHYNELKALATMIDGVENASVEFDPETLRPTFRLLIGQPGRSNAFIIAQRLGLPAPVVDRARAALSHEQLRADALLADLDRDRRAAATEREDARRRRVEAEALAERYRAELARVQEERREAVARARREAEERLQRTRRDLEDVLEAARAARSAEEARDARERLEALARSWAETGTEQGTPVPAGAPPEAVAVGQVVQLPGLGRTGRVLAPADARGEVEVAVGSVRARLPLAALRLPSEGAAPVEQGARATISPPRDVPLSLSLRGQTVDEALADVDRYLDEAALANHPRVTLIHGKGTGALRRAIQEFLRDHPHVRAFRGGDAREGGEGVTVVELKE